MAEAVILIEDLPVKDPSSKAKLITVSGQLDESNVDLKAKDIYKVFEEVPGKLSLVFDFAGLDYMNSKSIGYLTDWYGKVTEKGGKVFIARTKPNIKDILQVVGLTQLIQTFDTLDAAKQAVMQDSGVVTPSAQTAPVVAQTPAPVQTTAPAQATPAPITVQAPATPAQVTQPVAQTPATPPVQAPVATAAPVTQPAAPVTPAPVAPIAPVAQSVQPVAQTPATQAPVTTPPSPQPETYKLNA